MKHLILFFALVLTVSSCISKNKHQEELTAVRDSLNTVVANRDTEINQFISDFNDIQTNLDSIKKIENLVKVKSGNKEISSTTKDEIIQDLIQLQQLLDENKKLVDKLKGMRVADSRKLKSLQKTISLLEKQITDKDNELAALNAKIETLNIDVSDLKSTLEQLNQESERKSQELLQRENMMNQAWYIVESTDSLIDQQIVEKTGGFIGLGKTLKVSQSLNKEDFTMVDIRSFSSVPVNAKKAKLLTVHPEGSFHFENAEKSVESFVIDDPQAFWSVSKYLVIAKD
ncbi:hypothetical protein ACE1ET_15080 [Saccharicrinis sp. FJH62]|uniref:Cbp1 family collagen-binding glycoprotein adhesin n=1 Tax=Saccharicrinis sp. FJH62 TaxID=3344657 RepID=UPI0035D4B2CD